jgi:hypothetical protein
VHLCAAVHLGARVHLGTAVHLGARVHLWTAVHFRGRVHLWTAMHLGSAPVRLNGTARVLLGSTVVRLGASVPLDGGASMPAHTDVRSRGRGDVATARGSNGTTANRARACRNVSEVRRDDGDRRGHRGVALARPYVDIRKVHSSTTFGGEVPTAWLEVVVTPNPHVPRLNPTETDDRRTIPGPRDPRVAPGMKSIVARPPDELRTRRCTVGLDP